MDDVVRSPILDVRGLTIGFTTRRGIRSVVHDISFDIAQGETVGLMGESGAGKTVTALALLGLLPKSGRVAQGQVLWHGRDIARLTDRELRSVRGREIGIAFQDPNTSLHPTMRVDRQIAEALRVHDGKLGKGQALERAAELLERMGVPRARLTNGGYPFQWSGGMRQRALLAMALANQPDLLIADEITTALDVTTQARILELLNQVQRETGTSILLITHDAAVIADMADRVVVMRDGYIIESGDADAVFDHPRDTYTAALTSTVTRPHAAALESPLRAGATTTANPTTPARTGDAVGAGAASGSAEMLRVEELHVRYDVRTRISPGRTVQVHAVDGVSFRLVRAETIGIVGESGCGKSTLARALVRLEEPAAGRILLDGEDIICAAGSHLRLARLSIQIVFQDPYASLNPRRRIGESIAQPLRIHGRYRDSGGTRRIAELLDMVGLARDYATRFPQELSGGERQRVAIARALSIEPRVLVLDEPVSSLDSTTRTGILDVLRRLQDTLGLSYVFIAHDLRIVRGIAHRVAVMYDGRFVETAATEDLFRQPSHPYTQALLSAIPGRMAAALVSREAAKNDGSREEQL